MNIDEEVPASSRETSQEIPSFEDWAEEFRNKIKEKDGHMGSQPAGERERGKKYYRLSISVMLVAGAIFLTLSFLRIW